MYVCMYVGVCMYVCMYVCMHVCMCVCISMYVYMCVQRTRRSAGLHYSRSLQRHNVSGLYGQPGGYIFLQLHETAVEASSAVADVINPGTEDRSRGNA